MARQEGIIKLKVLWRYYFYKTKTGICSEKKESIDASRIKSDPHFKERVKTVLNLVKPEGW
jgi:hypothetical protein